MLFQWRAFLVTAQSCIEMGVFPSVAFGGDLCFLYGILSRELLLETRHNFDNISLPLTDQPFCGTGVSGRDLI